MDTRKKYDDENIRQILDESNSDFYDSSDTGIYNNVCVYQHINNTLCYSLKNKFTFFKTYFYLYRLI